MKNRDLPMKDRNKKVILLSIFFFRMKREIQAVKIYEDHGFFGLCLEYGTHRFSMDSPSPPRFWGMGHPSKGVALTFWTSGDTGRTCFKLMKWKNIQPFDAWFFWEATEKPMPSGGFQIGRRTGTPPGRLYVEARIFEAHTNCPPEIS